MAKKMIEEILLAEENAEKIIADAKKQAEDILKNAQISDEQKKLENQKSAKQTAEEIISNAKTEAEKIMETAKNESSAENKNLEELYAKNKEAAIALAVAVLAE